jgi:hypothetical protein
MNIIQPEDVARLRLANRQIRRWYQAGGWKYFNLSLALMNGNNYAVQIKL